jgi:predicted DNA-binding antitoxin AbrB/MazE fold protein
MTGKLSAGCLWIRLLNLRCLRRRLNNVKSDISRIYTKKGTLIMSASETIDCVYEGGVFKPLEKVKLAEGAKLWIKIEKVDVSNFYGIFGKASVDRLEEFEGEAYL